MPIILIIFIFFGTFFKFSMNKYLAPISHKLNIKCLNEVASESRYSSLWQSFLCGKKLDLKKEKNTLIKTGLYHLIVVSGGHFMFIDKTFKFLKLPFIFRVLILFLYYLTSGLQAPGARAFFHLVTYKIKQYFDFKISNTQITFFSGILCLILNMDYWRSLSFWLSWIVSLAIGINDSLFYTENEIQKKILQIFLIYFFTWPFVNSFSFSHPGILFIGTVLLNPTFYILFTSAFLTLFLKFTAGNYFLNLLDFLMDLFFFFSCETDWLCWLKKPISHELEFFLDISFFSHDFIPLLQNI